MLRLHASPLRHLIPALLLAFAVVTGSISYIVEMDAARRQVEQRERQALATLLAGLQDRLEYVAARGDWVRFRDEVAALGANPVISEALVVDADARVLASLHRSHLQQPMEEALGESTAGARQALLAQLRVPLAAGAINAHADGSLLGAYPLALPGGDGPRPLREARLLARADLALPLAQSRKAALDRVLFFGQALGGLALLLWALAWLVTERRMQALIGAADRLAAGDLSARAGLCGRDEFARMGRAFDTMAERIRRGHEALRTTAERLAELTRASPTVLYALERGDAGFRPVWVSENVERVVGFGADHVLTPEWWAQRLHPDDRDRALAAFATLELEQRLVHTYRVLRADGSTLWVQDELRLVDGGARAVGAWTDITELRLSEQRVQRLNSLYAAQSETSQAIARAMHQEVLFAEVCRIAVEHGGLAAAAIALPDAHGHLAPAATHTCSAELEAPVAASITGPSRALLAAPLASGRHSVVPAPDEMRPALQAVAAFPLRRAGEPAGVLLLYAADAGYFDADLLRLLEEMAADISFALDNLDLDAQHRRAIEALAESEERLRATFEQAAVGMAQVAGDGRLLRVNQTLCEILGRARNQLLDASLGELTHPDDAAAQEEAAQRMLRGETDSHVSELRYLRPDGEVAWVRRTLSLVRSLAREPKYFIAVVEDITERRRKEEWLRLAGSVLANAREGVMITDARARIVFVNRAFTEITGYSEDEVRGRNPALLRSGRHDEAFYDAMWQQVSATGHWQGEVWNRARNGRVFPEWLDISAIRDERGEVTHYVGLFSDMSEHKAFEEHIQHLAHFDALTDLPNRALMRDRLEQALAHARRDGREVAVLFLDLDRFKLVNDTLGHTAGDALLRTAAQRLRGLIREGDTVSRLGGDEFVLVLPDLSDGRDASRVARKALEALAEPFALGGRQINIGASIGISLFPADGGDADTLLQHADTAMYQAKESGRNTYQFFIAEMNARAIERMTLESELRASLQRGDFLLHFQPKVSLVDGRLLGFESLVRWRHPQWGMVSPGRFIPVAEDSGLIVPLGDWILEEACAVAAAWRRDGLPQVPLAINVSAIQFQRGDFVDRVVRALATHGLPGSALQLELTESIVMGQGDELLAAVRRLKALGLTLAIDDFGTGYSSLSYLRRLEVDAVKIDKSFVDDVLTDPDAESIALAIIQMAHSLRLQVVAEGVETEAQADFLRRSGCETCQGYLFGRPVPEAEARALLAPRQRIAAV